MNILGDQQIPLLQELFGSLGQVHTYSGRTLAPGQLDNIDALITRSTLHVDQALLENSSVRFVGTCTIGTDHLDTDYLNQQGIAWTNASGCNAQAVVQYVLSAMASLAPNWLEAEVGIIAQGNIGSRVYRRLKALGVSCYCYDPLIEAQQCPDLVSLERVLQCDIISSHAPLTVDGPHPSYHMLGKAELETIRPGSLLISAGRGAVIDNAALLALLQKEKRFKLALDVWENEPDILTPLIDHADIVTPHIAGHSLEGKEQGSAMVYKALCDQLSLSLDHNALAALNTEQTKLDGQWLEPFAACDAPLFNRLLLTMYPIMEDDRRLRAWQTLGSNSETMAQYFDKLRKTYPVRREYTHFILPQWVSESSLGQWMRVLTDVM